jgi:hypothetical protein
MVQVDRARDQSKRSGMMRDSSLFPPEFSTRTVINRPVAAAIVFCGRALAHFTLTHHSPLLFVIIIITAAEVRSDTCIFRLDGECDNNLAPFCTAGMFCLFFVSRLIHADQAAPRGDMGWDGSMMVCYVWHPQWRRLDRVLAHTSLVDRILTITFHSIPSYTYYLLGTDCYDCDPCVAYAKDGCASCTAQSNCGWCKTGASGIDFCLSTGFIEAMPSLCSEDGTCNNACVVCASVCLSRRGNSLRSWFFACFSFSLAYTSKTTQAVPNGMSVRARRRLPR